MEYMPCSGLSTQSSFILNILSSPVSTFLAADCKEVLLTKDKSSIYMSSLGAGQEQKCQNMYFIFKIRLSLEENDYLSTKMKTLLWITPQD